MQVLESEEGMRGMEKGEGGERRGEHWARGKSENKRGSPQRNLLKGHGNEADFLGFLH
jgi:hypothetical protein